MHITEQPVFSLQIVRKATGQAIFDTGLPGLVFSEQFIQLPVGSLALPCPGPAALQEPVRPGRARAAHLQAQPGRVEGVAAVRQGQPAGRGTHLQVQPVRSPSKVGGGGHARYTVVEDDGSTHGVLFINANAQEFETFPLPGVVYRTIGGLLDLLVFLGPGPEDVVRQHTAAVGRFLRPSDQDYPQVWSAAVLGPRLPPLQVIQWFHDDS